MTRELARLRATVEKLEATMRTTTTRIPEDRSSDSPVERPKEATGRSEASASSPTGKDLLAKTDPERRKPLANIRALPEDQRHRAHMFWSMGEVLEKYGQPDSAYVVDGMLVLAYQDAVGVILIKLFDGMVVSTQILR